MQHKCGRRGKHIVYWWKIYKERNHKEDHDDDNNKMYLVGIGLD
jgi:hypothetical protein